MNLATMRGKEEEVVHIMEEKKLDLLGVCETRTKHEGEKKIHNDFKYIYKGNEEGRHGVGFVQLPQGVPLPPVFTSCLDVVTLT